ncbi:unnamed protein product [Darwinula stevensoni]|uniref:Uncharacterized protein n=1 Tax=Darwinula stevensoni TaxID=69355 RepID=A0A7R9A9U4_9CRUS|nr:unnamed protein product [Darwinula stevensoni]CAG0897683.1 unnamed protein product [Darwinula stevensoni]
MQASDKFHFRDKWAFFWKEGGKVYFMVADNVSDEGKRLKMKGGNRREYTAITQAKLHQDSRYVEFEFEATQRTAAMPIKRILINNKITRELMAQYLKTKQRRQFVEHFNKVLRNRSQEHTGQHDLRREGRLMQVPPKVQVLLPETPVV